MTASGLRSFAETLQDPEGLTTLRRHLMVGHSIGGVVSVSLCTETGRTVCNAQIELCWRQFTHRIPTKTDSKTNYQVSTIS